MFYLNPTYSTRWYSNKTCQNLLTIWFFNTALSVIYQFIGPFSSLTSPGYPSNYGNNVYKIWTINAPAGYIVINFKFIDFNLEYHYSCRYDWVKIVDSNGAEIMPKRCGARNPGTFRCVFLIDKIVSLHWTSLIQNSKYA